VISRFELVRYQDTQIVTAVIWRWQLCYEMSNAVRATITPEIGELKNVVQDCVQVGSQQPTTYTLTAVGEDDQRVTQTTGSQRFDSPN
jgi:hypothetical protein